MLHTRKMMEFVLIILFWLSALYIRLFIQFWRFQFHIKVFVILHTVRWWNPRVLTVALSKTFGFVLSSAKLSYILKHLNTSKWSQGSFCDLLNLNGRDENHSNSIWRASQLLFDCTSKQLWRSTNNTDIWKAVCLLNFETARWKNELF